MDATAIRSQMAQLSRLCDIHSAKSHYSRAEILHEQWRQLALQLEAAGEPIAAE
jgi:hypothetical protein